MVKKAINKNKIKNKNTNFVNVSNTIKIGSNKKRAYRKRNQPKSGAPIIVNVPQSFPQPYYIPSQPFHTQPPVLDAPVEIKNPTRPIIDDMKRDSTSTINEIKNIPHTIPIKSKPLFKDISQVVPHISPQYPIKNEIIETPTKSFEEFKSGLKESFKELQSKLHTIGAAPVKDDGYDSDFQLHPNTTDNRKQRKKNATFQSIETPLKSSPLKKDSDTSPKVLNPVSGRFVKIGGKTYKQLRKNGKI